MTNSTQQPKSRRSRSVIFVVAAFVIGFVLIIGISALLAVAVGWPVLRLSGYFLALTVGGWILASMS